MGKCDLPYAVTDARGLVYGVDALRVVDASIFPSIFIMFLYFIIFLNVVIITSFFFVIVFLI